MSTFDPSAFLDQSTNEVSKKRPPIPVGDYTGMIGEVTAAPWQSQKDPTKSGMRLVTPIKIELPPEVQARLDIPFSSINLTDSIMLDLTAEGMIDYAPGKNSRLRMYREATDMNKPGDTFSPRKLSNRMVKVKIGHEIYNDAPVERVEAVARA